MSDGTKIEWTDATWNVVNGCSVTSPGCTNCYAMRLAGTRLKHVESRKGLTIDSKAGPVWNGTTKFNEPVLLDPIRWKRPRRIFVCAHGDLFHESVPDEWIDRVVVVMALARQHQFQVLTKRSARMREYFTRLHDEPDRDTLRRLVAAWPAGSLTPEGGVTIPLPNVWLGVSVEDQARADERIPDLLATPAAVRWLSCEPLLGPVVLHPTWLPSTRWPPLYSKRNSGFHDQPGGGLHWVVAGGESGPGARPMHPDWARSLRDQCAAAGVAFHFKQWGNWLPCAHLTSADQSRWAPRALDGSGRVFDFARNAGRSTCIMANPTYRQDDDPFFWWFSKKIAGRLLDGVTHDGFPA